MGILALETKEAAKLLGVMTRDIEKKYKTEILTIGRDKLISIFKLASILDTTPEDLLELIEDLSLGELISEVEAEPAFGYSEAIKHYRNSNLGPKN